MAAAATSLHAKYALVTGCSSGIGAALAIEFAKQGVRVIATARTEADLLRLRQSHANITALHVDLRDDQSISKLRAEVEAITGGGLDYLVNNAGAHYASTAIDLEVSRVRQVFEVNLFAVMRTCQVFSHLLILRKGTIVQIGSVTRAVPMIWQSPYNATKAALSQYTKTLRLELDPFGVRVVEVVTGFVQSNILRSGLVAPADSLYFPIKDHIETLKHQGNSRGMPAPEYARRVVKRVTQSHPPREFWEGGRSFMLWFVVSWLPLWLSFSLFYYIFRLRQLRP